MNTSKQERVKISLLSFVLISLLSCKKDKTNLEYGFDFYPISQGSHWVYEVQEIRHDVSSDTLSFLLKEEISEVFIDGLNRVNYQIKRFSKLNDSLPWYELDAWYLYKDSSRIERVENDRRIISMIFPIRDGKSWVGNELNDSENWEWIYIDKGMSYDLPNENYSNTVKIQQRDNHNLIEYEKAHEVYAYGVGLIEKKYIDLDINNFDPTLITKGVEFTKRLKSYSID